MIDSVRIQNYKSLRDVSIDLERFTVFVGANGCGKTSVLEAIHNAVRAATGDPKKVFAHGRHGDWVYSRQGRGDLSIACRTGQGEFRVEATPPMGGPPAGDPARKGLWRFRTVPQGPALDRALEPARALMFLHLNAAVMAAASYDPDPVPRMLPTGKGLATVLRHMSDQPGGGFEELVRTAKALIPRLRRVGFRRERVFLTESEFRTIDGKTFERLGRKGYIGDQVVLDFDHAENVSLRAASEGTVFLLGLLAVLLGPVKPQVVLLDDIEHGLHPLAQKQLVEVIGGIMERFPGLQVLCTAHSPYLLDYVKPEQVRVMATGPDGYARCDKLTRHPKFERWKREFAPGEMWSIFGEKWVFDPEAANV